MFKTEKALEVGYILKIILLRITILIWEPLPKDFNLGFPQIEATGNIPTQKASQEIRNSS